MDRQKLDPVNSQVTDYIAKLYHDYARRLYYTAFKYTSNHTVAEDAV